MKRKTEYFVWDTVLLFLAGLAIFVCLDLSARGTFGGSRSSSFSSSTSSSRSGGASYFGGSRSAGSAVTITRPSAPTKALNSGSSPVIINNGSGGGGGGFFSGYLWGSMLNRHSPVIVENSGVPVHGNYVENTHGVLYYAFWTLMVLILLGVLVIAGMAFFESMGDL